MDEVRFCRTKEKWGALSNFAPYPVLIDGKRWACTEHYYQAMKFPNDEGSQDIIRMAMSPKVAAEIGRTYGGIRPDWDQVKELYMLIAIVHKAMQYEEVRDLLLETGDRRIVEYSAKDSYWGCGADGLGKNRLGELWMVVRTIIRSNI